MAFTVRILYLVTIVVIGCTCTDEQPLLWAVLVAGSHSYKNYRHQADVCHAYHLLREHGVSAKRIITMMYDDIASNPENPFPGKIFNAVNGSDVYDGVVKDYIGKDVNPLNFLKIIKGDARGMKGIGSGRVLKSGMYDHVFIYFVGHGGNYILDFPHGVLYAHDLLREFMIMSEKKTFAKMVVYIEACKSGSLFDKFLSDNLNIYAVTAAERNQNSYACCWDKKLHTYLGDAFSINWMDDSENENLEKETLAEQYAVVVQETKRSNPQEFGTLSVSESVVGEFFGMKQFPKSSRKTKTRYGDGVISPNVPVAILQRKLESAQSKEEAAQIASDVRTLFKLRRSVDHVVKHLLSYAYGSNRDKLEYLLNAQTELSLEQLPCYKNLSQHWFRNCYDHSTSPYALQKLHVFANICSVNSQLADQMIDAMNIICPLIKVKKGIQ